MAPRIWRLIPDFLKNLTPALSGFHAVTNKKYEGGKI
jgi:hypothetical protein